MTEHGAQADLPEIDEIISRLEYELGRSRPADGADGAAPRLAARAESERLAGVTADRPYLYKPGLVGRIRGLFLVPVKFVLRKLMRWYVEPLAADQRAFNYSVLRLLDTLSERLDATDARTTSRAESLEAEIVRVEAARAQLEAEANARGEQLGTAVEELDDRLVRVERRPAGQPAPAPAGAAGAPSAPAEEIPFDYFAFESRMRGPRALIAGRQRAYVDEFRDAAPVLDVGCGRGEFLSLLAEAGIEARGVDVDADMVAFSRGEGLDVEQRDAIAYLGRADEGAFGGIFAAQFVEHLRAGPLMTFLNLAASRLRPGGVFILETINPLSLFALRNYFADVTHAQPLIPDTLSLLAKQAGFDEVEIRFLNEPEDAQKLEPVELPSDPAFDPARRALESNRVRLNEVVFGPQDYALVARR